MALASAIIGVVGDLLVLIALIVAVKALTTARRSRDDAVTADKAASGARLEAANREIEAVGLARKSLEQAQTGAKEADQRAEEAAERSEAAGVAAAERDQAAVERSVARDQEAFLERQYERVLTVGHLVEDMFWAIQPYTEQLNPSTGQQTSAAEVPRDIWMPARNALRHHLVGLKAVLPSCKLIVDAGTAFQAFDGCVLGRNEVEAELQRIDGALDELRTVFRVRLGPDPQRG